MCPLFGHFRWFCQSAAINKIVMHFIIFPYGPLFGRLIHPLESQFSCIFRSPMTYYNYSCSHPYLVFIGTHADIVKKTNLVYDNVRSCCIYRFTFWIHIQFVVLVLSRCHHCESVRARALHFESVHCSLLSKYLLVEVFIIANNFTWLNFQVFQ